MSRLGSRLAAVTVAALLSLPGCGDGIVLPDEGVPAAITDVDGNEQIGAAGATLGGPLVVEVSDERGRPVANQEVSFTVVTGSGQVPATDVTDANGIASVSWTLGPGVGAQRVRAQVTGSGIPPDLAVEFTATALAGSGSTLVLSSGDNQSAAVGAALANPLVVKVLDPLGNPVSGQTINWSVTGGGSISPATSVTGSDGQSSAQRVLGPTSGSQTTQAAAEGLAGSPVTFTHTAGASTPTLLVRISGDGQTAPAGFQLPDSLVVRLLDGNGNGVAGRTVTWVVAAGAGVVSPLNSQTDADGLAVTRWTLGAGAGSYTLNAVFSGLASVGFTATATADVPTSIALLSGDGQSGIAGAALGAPLRVRITDANDNPVENVTVTWAAIGGGTVSSTTTGSDAQGIAQVTRTLGPIPGSYGTTATVTGLAGSPVTFSSSATVGPAARLAFLTQPAGAQVGQTLAPFEVEIQDAQGNRVATATTGVTITSSVTGTLLGDNTESAAGGVATFDALALDEARTGYTLIARSSGLADATSQPFDVTPGATTVAITGRTPGSSVAGQAVSFNFNVDVVAPAGGNLTGNVTVSDGVTSSTCGTNNAGVGSCLLTFPTAGDRTVTATYIDDPNFAGSTSAGLGVTVGKGSSTVTITDEDPETSAVGDPVLVSFTVDGNGGGVAPTGTVTISASGTETCTESVAVGSCTLTLTAPGNRTLTATYAGDDNYNGDTDTEGHEVNAGTPNAVNDDYTVTEEQTLSPNASEGVLSNDTDAQPLTAAIVSGPSHAASFTLNADGSFSYTPAQDYEGPDEFTYQASDGTQTDQATVSITVTHVNDDPSFTAGVDQSVSSGLGQILGVVVPGWATNISAGPGEAGQPVSFQVSTDNDGAFITPPTVDDDGTLRFRPAGRPDTVIVTVTVAIVDEDGATSPAQQFTITITP